MSVAPLKLPWATEALVRDTSAALARARLAPRRAHGRARADRGHAGRAEPALHPLPRPARGRLRRGRAVSADSRRSTATTRPCRPGRRRSSMSTSDGSWRGCWRPRRARPGFSSRRSTRRRASIPTSCVALLEGGASLPADDAFGQVARAFSTVGLFVHVPDGRRARRTDRLRWSHGRSGFALISRTILRARSWSPRAGVRGAGRRARRATGSVGKQADIACGGARPRSTSRRAPRSTSRASRTSGRRRPRSSRARHASGRTPRSAGRPRAWARVSSAAASRTCSTGVAPR